MTRKRLNVTYDYVFTCSDTIFTIDLHIVVEDLPVTCGNICDAKIVIVDGMFVNVRNSLLYFCAMHVK